MLLFPLVTFFIFPALLLEGFSHPFHSLAVSLNRWDNAQDSLSAWLAERRREDWCCYGAMRKLLQALQYHSGCKSVAGKNCHNPIIASLFPPLTLKNKFSRKKKKQQKTLQNNDVKCCKAYPVYLIALFHRHAQYISFSGHLWDWSCNKNPELFSSTHL